MWHTALITIHASAGSVALVTGFLALTRPPWFRTYLWCVVAMVAALLAAVAVDWRGLEPGVRATFLGLAVLGLVILHRALSARRLLPSAGLPGDAYVGHVGFTVISLADGFVVVSAIDLGAPVWVVVASAVSVVALGHVAIRSRVAAVSV